MYIPHCLACHAPEPLNPEYEPRYRLFRARCSCGVVTWLDVGYVVVQMPDAEATVLDVGGNVMEGHR